MTTLIRYALDFDGVICDSAIETAVSGFRAAQYFWPEMAATEIEQAQIDAFRQVRPWLETGYEAILIMRALFQGMSVADLCAHYDAHMAALISADQLDITELKSRFASIRDQWIQQDEQDWLDHNPLFSGMADKLRKLPKDALYIVTTKQERFVERIIQGSGIDLPMSHIFGMDRQRSKQETLQQLLSESPDTPMIFIEDRLPTLLKVQNNPALESIKLQLAGWGYNTRKDIQTARLHKIEIVTLGSFCSIP